MSSSKKRSPSKRRSPSSSSKGKAGAPAPPVPPAGIRDLKTEFGEFLLADEMPSIVKAFNRSLEAAGVSTEATGAPRFEEVRSGLQPAANFRQKRLFEGLAGRLARYSSIVLPKASSDKNRSLLIVGAGPCGLRAAIEAATLGFHVTIIEGRASFSRHNVLKTWLPTVHDLMELGHGVFHPKFQVHGSHCVGTRELQMTLLKAALILGVRFIHSEFVGGVSETDTKGRFIAWTTPSKPVAATADGETDALALKPNASTEGAEKLGKVDFTERAASESGAITKTPPPTARGKYPFDILIDGSGEKSKLTRNLGFDKALIKFGPAIGFVANFTKDPSKSEKSFPPEIVAGFNDFKSAQLAAVAKEGIMVESLEYMRGGTHFIAATILRQSAMKLGIFREDKPTIVQCLTKENVDVDALKKVARKFAKAIGLPPDTEFAPVNPVQIFDFSVKGQLKRPYRNAPFPFFPVGDALSSPYWPQGLGVNRGFHTAMDAVWAARFSALGEDPGPEREMAWMLQNYTVWRPSMLADQKTWTADPIMRYSPAFLPRIQLDEDKRHWEKVTKRAVGLLDEMKGRVKTGKHGGMAF